MGAWRLECLLRPGDEQPAEYPGAFRIAARGHTDARRNCLRAHCPCHWPDALFEQHLLRPDGTQTGAEGRAHGCHGHAGRAQRAAYVHCGAGHYAAGQDCERRSHPGLAGRAGMGLHRRAGQPERRVLRTLYPQADSPCSPARNTGRGVDRLHLHPSWHADPDPLPLDRPGVSGDRPGRLVCRCPVSGQAPGRSGGDLYRYSHGLGSHPPGLGTGDGSGCPARVVREPGCLPAGSTAFQSDRRFQEYCTLTRDRHPLRCV